MIRGFFKKISTDNPKFNNFLNKYKLPKAYFAINRRAVTKGLFVGLFWGFIPMPFQMLGVIATTPILRFNVIIGLATVWLSNPITYPPLWYLEYQTGNLILDMDGISDIQLTMHWFQEHWNDIVIPLYIGASFYSTVISFAIYLLVNFLWIKSVHKEKKRRYN